MSISIDSAITRQGLLLIQIAAEELWVPQTEDRMIKVRQSGKNVEMYNSGLASAVTVLNPDY